MVPTMNADIPPPPPPPPLASTPAPASGAADSSIDPSYLPLRKLQDALATKGQTDWKALSEDVKNLVKQLNMVTEEAPVDIIEATPMNFQASLSANDVESLMQRAALKQRPMVQGAIQQWWGRLEKNEQGCIEKATYVSMCKEMFPVVDPTMPAHKYDEIIERDWQFDSRGKATMDFQAFSDAMFIFMDLWSGATTSEQDYGSFMHGVDKEVQVQRKKARERAQQLEKITRKFCLEEEKARTDFEKTETGDREVLENKIAQTLEKFRKEEERRENNRRRAQQKIISDESNERVGFEAEEKAARDAMKKEYIAARREIEQILKARREAEEALKRAREQWEQARQQAREAVEKEEAARRTESDKEEGELWASLLKAFESERKAIVDRQKELMRALAKALQAVIPEETGQRNGMESEEKAAREALRKEMLASKREAELAIKARRDAEDQSRRARLEWEQGLKQEREDFIEFEQYERNEVKKEEDEDWNILKNAHEAFRKVIADRLKEMQRQAEKEAREREKKLKETQKQLNGIGPDEQTRRAWLERSEKEERTAIRQELDKVKLAEKLRLEAEARRLEQERLERERRLEEERKEAEKRARAFEKALRDIESEENKARKLMEKENNALRESVTRIYSKEMGFILDDLKAREKEQRSMQRALDKQAEDDANKAKRQAQMVHEIFRSLILREEGHRQLLFKEEFAYFERIRRFRNLEYSQIDAAVATQLREKRKAELIGIFREKAFQEALSSVEVIETKKRQMFCKGEEELRRWMREDEVRFRERLAQKLKRQQMRQRREEMWQKRFQDRTEKGILAEIIESFTAEEPRQREAIEENENDEWAMILASVQETLELYVGMESVLNEQAQSEEERSQMKVTKQRIEAAITDFDQNDNLEEMFDDALSDLDDITLSAVRISDADPLNASSPPESLLSEQGIMEGEPNENWTKAGSMNNLNLPRAVRRVFPVSSSSSTNLQATSDFGTRVNSVFENTVPSSPTSPLSPQQKLQQQLQQLQKQESSKSLLGNEWTESSQGSNAFRRKPVPTGLNEAFTGFSVAPDGRRIAQLSPLKSKINAAVSVSVNSEESGGLKRTQSSSTSGANNWKRLVSKIHRQKSESLERHSSSGSFRKIPVATEGELAIMHDTIPSPVAVTKSNIAPPSEGFRLVSRFGSPKLGQSRSRGALPPIRDASPVRIAEKDTSSPSVEKVTFGSPPDPLSGKVPRPFARTLSPIPGAKELVESLSASSSPTLELDQIIPMVGSRPQALSPSVVKSPPAGGKLSPLSSPTRPPQMDGDLLSAKVSAFS